MLVELPRNCSGQEIVDSFKKASSFAETPVKRWEGVERCTEFEWNSDGKCPSIGGVSVVTAPSFLEKRFGFFGEESWVTYYNIKFTLAPVMLKTMYTEVNISFEYVCDEEDLVTEFDHPSFKEISPYLEKIITDFLARLKS